MHTPAPYPAGRPRRLRRDAFTRDLVRENSLAPDDLILPVFLLDGQRQEQDVASMPGVKRRSIDGLFAVAEDCLRLGVPVMALFPVLDLSLKTPDGREATNPEGLVPRSVRELKKRFPELGLLTEDLDVEHFANGTFELQEPDGLTRPGIDDPHTAPAWFVTLRMTVLRENVNALIRAYDLIRVDGLGKRHSGNYFARAVTHLVDHTRHLMDLELVRNAWE